MFTLPLIVAALSYKTMFMVAAPLATGAVAYLLVRGDSRVEARREKSIELSRLASEEGFPHVVPILDSYAVGDYSGVISSMHALSKILLDPAQRRQAFETMLGVQVKLHVTDEAKLKKLEQVLAQHGYSLVKKPAEPTVAA